ncbi:MAG: RraA family protein [Opitutales bacterium]|jgi:4-hydroxy-4-methyl-2-oxoglutarate aldolase|nr:RraA family protein [Opitutales bacterium]MBT5816318.1 RraA family protein [Opitutales bacterium]MBT7865538.1 RraA family protein [Opitutales bacterium]
MMLPHSTILQLKRWNTPTIYNGWEQLTKHDRTKDGFNLEPTTDYMPELGPMVGYAVTVRIEPSNPIHAERKGDFVEEYREYIASIPGPKIVVVQDLDHPNIVGSYWGEVNSSIHKALGCVGTITDGAIRDVDEMMNAGFKALARRLCVGHAYSVPVEWNCDVEVYGRSIQPGQLIHADKHGFLAIPKEDEESLLEASVFMDQNECNTLIPAASSSCGKPASEILNDINKAAKAFGEAVKDRFGGEGEW